MNWYVQKMWGLIDPCTKNMTQVNWKILLMKSFKKYFIFYLHYTWLCGSWYHNLILKKSPFENMTACFWSIKIHFGKKWFLNIDSSIVIALQTGLKQIIKLQYPNLSNRYLRKAKNRNKCKVISLFAELLFSIFS